MVETFYWHDYETWGADPRRDRPSQFAGLRTDADLNEIPSESPLVVYCRPADDFLPAPEAALVTGLTPQQVAREGLAETQFAAAIHHQLSRSGTCSVGYNSIRFDEEVSRFLFYRNFLDPYGHASRNGNSRWDLIDVMRLAHALRPDGIDWPRHPGGEPSFRLEHLTAANGIEHQGAHDALADVRATLALARRLRDAQPRLFQYALGLRAKQRVRELLDRGQPVLHVSSKYPATRGCLAPIMVVAPPGPEDNNGMLVWDLREDPTQLQDLSVEQVRERVFTPADQRPADAPRLPLKKLRLNAVPMVAPLNTLSPQAAEQWAIDQERVAVHYNRLSSHPEQVRQVAAKVRAAFAPPARSTPQDADEALYAGFVPDEDRQRMARLRALPPGELADAQLVFQDQRLNTLLFRYRARNWPELLSAAERAEWDQWRLGRLREPDATSGLALPDYRRRIAELRGEQAGDERSVRILNALDAWLDSLLATRAVTSPDSWPASAPAG